MPALKRRLYQLILRLHPASFRDRFAREMSLDFEDALAAYGFSRLLADATRSLFRQWTAPAFSAYQEQAPVSSHPLLAGHYMPLTDAPLTPFEFLRGSVLFALLLFLLSLALNARTSRDFRNADAMDGRGLGHATSAISPTEAKASSQGVLPTSVQLEAVVPEWLFTPDAKSSRPAPGMPWRNFLLSCASVSAIIWLTSFLVRRSRTISARVALTAVGLVAVAISTAFVPTRAPAMHAQTSSPPPATKNPPTSPAPLRSTLPPLDAISVKPDNSGGGRSRLLYTVDGVSATNVSVYMLLKEAYHLNDDQIVDAPVWAKTDRFDIEGKVTGPEATLIAGFAHDQQRTFYQQLLTARFGLTSHREARDLPEYALTIGKAGSRLQESKTDPNTQAEKPPVPMFRMRADKDGKKIEASNASLAPFLNLLSNEVGRTVIDRTGLKDHYDFTLSWSPEGLSNLPSPEVQAPIGAPAANPGLFTAIQEQLGLKLEPVKGSIEVLVIDHIEKPSEN